MMIRKNATSKVQCMLFKMADYQVNLVNSYVSSNFNTYHGGTSTDCLPLSVSRTTRTVLSIRLNQVDVLGVSINP